MELDKEDVFQAIVLMDTFNNNFSPITRNKPMGFLSVAGVPLIDYTLQSLAVGGITEAVLFCCQDAHIVKEYIKESSGLWKCTMDVQVVSSDTCQSVGDVMREIDAASLVKGDFILLGINTVTNINFACLLDQHKLTAKKDKGVAMTLVYKELPHKHPLIKSDKSIFIAADGKNQKVLFHQKFKANSGETAIALPTKHLLSHSEVKLHQNLVDPNIAVCSPSVPPLFADNFDFQSRDDFIHGLLIQEDILTDSLYYTFVKSNKYAAAITNWKTFQTVCRDVFHNWAYPLSIESGAYKEFVYSGKHIYRNKTATLNRSCNLVEDVLIGAGSQLGANSTVSESFIGDNVTIGNNCTIIKSYIANGVVIRDNGKISKSYIDDDCIVNENCSIEGTIIPKKTTVPPGTNLNGIVMAEVENEKGLGFLFYAGLVDWLTCGVITKATKIKVVQPDHLLSELKLSTSESGTEWENDSVGSSQDDFVGFDKKWSDSESCYSSDVSDDSSDQASPIPDDTNIFLNEVIDSLARGYEDKLKCDYLILEINSSRYAYNIQLHEVNFYVVKALLSLPHLEKAKSFHAAFRDVVKFFSPIFANYIKSKTSIMDCLKAIEETSIQCERLQGHSGHVLHMLYDYEIIDEDSLLEFYEYLKENDSPLLQLSSVNMFFEWLQKADEESDESD